MVGNFLAEQSLPGEDRIGTREHHLALSGRTCGLLRNATAHHAERPGFRVRRDRRPIENGAAIKSEGVELTLPPVNQSLISDLLTSGFAGFQHPNAFADVWQANGEREAFVLAALDRELAAMLAHDAAHDQ